MTAKLMVELPAEAAAPLELIDKGRILDASYIPPRSPDSFPEGAPFEHYGSIQSEEAVCYAGEIIAFVRQKMAGPD